MFVFEWYSVYTISTSIHDCFEQAVKTVTTLNEVRIYENLRENVMDLNDEALTRLITTDELVAEVTNELGLVEEGDALVKKNSVNNIFYSISEVEVVPFFMDQTNTLCFEVTGIIEIPLGILRGSSFTTIRLDLDVRSMYSSTLRVER